MVVMWSSKFLFCDFFFPPENPEMSPAPESGGRPLALEDQLVLCHDLVPANSPASLPAMTTTRMTPSGPKSDEGDGRRQHKRDIIESLDGGRRQRGQ